MRTGNRKEVKKLQSSPAVTGPAPTIEGLLAQMEEAARQAQMADRAAALLNKWAAR